MVFLTYTRIFVKHDSYLASILNLDEGDPVSTEESSLQDRFKVI